MATQFNLDEEFATIQEEMQRARSFSNWEPPDGDYECLLSGFAEGQKEVDGTLFPWFKPEFTILAPDGYANEKFTRIFSTRPSKGRGFAMEELRTIASKITGDEIKGVTDAVAALNVAADSGDSLINVSVRRETSQRDPKRSFVRYTYYPAQ